MSGSDKARNKAQRLKGAFKEVVGRATGDVALERQGQAGPARLSSERRWRKDQRRVPAQASARTPDTSPARLRAQARPQLRTAREEPGDDRHACR
jgi:hypothetical protein